MKQKQIFKLLLLGLVVMLTILPVVTTFNASLTQLFNKIGFYKTIQDNLVPFEAKMVVSAVRTLGVPAFLSDGNQEFLKEADFFLLKDNEYHPVDMQWNCLGWQSLLLLLISFGIGLQGGHKKLSIIECMLIGIIGTFLINIFRMVFITIGLYYVNTVFALLIHDYFAALTTIVWLFFFWWFSYKYVLEERQLVKE